MIDKIYKPQTIEPATSAKRSRNKVYSQHDHTKPPFTILLPPPNVTGMLHIGHAIDTYLQDTIIRFKRFDGFDTFYVAGMDHAGIATQSKVESVLYQTQGLTRHDLGREKFLAKVWEWKEEYAQKFRQQWAALGLALDYDKERFTLDEKSNQAVNKAFIELYNKGLIYRDVKAINWDPVLKTAVSNIEVYTETTKQEMLYIKYPIKDSNEFVVIATVRPETMLSDVAVVYNPTDTRYNHKKWTIIHPLTGKELPMIADKYVDPKFGTGLMKLSAHAEADVEIMQKHNLPINETIDQDGKINCPDSPFHGLDRFVARQTMKEHLQKHGFIEKIRKVNSQVGHSERSKTPIEVLVMPQWFVKMDVLSKNLIKHLRGKNGVKFIPPRFKNVLQKWMENVHDWNISRQLWWGHRIPAWYKDNEIKVQVESPGAGWTQDPDVLDTWFSSGLAPFSFLGWPEQSADLQRYYPASLLVTGYDIIFFWVARMYFFGLEFTDQAPFENVLIHGLVRDENGRKMSKSLNNGVDPMEVIAEYGSDALRWYLITNSTAGLDLNFSMEGVKRGFALCNKLWNIARFIQQLDENSTKNEIQELADTWIDRKISHTYELVERLMKKYEFTVIGRKLERFVMQDFSSWYVEILKVGYNKTKLLATFKKLLILLHPFLPFITDHLYQTMYGEEITAVTFKTAGIVRKHSAGEATYRLFNDIISTVKGIRDFREKFNLSKNTVIQYDFYSRTPDLYSIKNNEIAKKVCAKLANAEWVQNSDYLHAKIEAEYDPEEGGYVYILLDRQMREQQIKQLKKSVEHLTNEIQRSKRLLSNNNFLLKAPKKLIHAEQRKIEYNSDQLEYVKENLEQALSNYETQLATESKPKEK
ncbi:valine--tRNA ligase [Mycoplasmopsis columbinasalis]|uniref:Valine--tRNA ligase n=1 Tax=Mycoplasmopsis columbinasalis TaxID=114880 RepID=A0A449BAM1_9BACT|nr:valine--tRNA ligase [Mycoplasmopsis columbinasalis]VEU78236.1 Valine--tRNA ligase [Mycoplasmopsis columbinasalis]